MHIYGLYIRKIIWQFQSITELGYLYIYIFAYIYNVINYHPSKDDQQNNVHDHAYE